MEEFSDTIFALASGAGRSAIAVVRLSGPATARTIEQLCGRLPKPRRASLAKMTASRSGEILDRGLVLWLPGPASFTGEDSGELHLHGGRAVIAGVLEELAALGCRPAEAGEFSRRAFFHGKINLDEAEGLADLVAAETKAQRAQALRQLEGALGALTESWRAQLLRASALIEAEIDFSDEDDVPEITVTAVQGLLRPIAQAVGERLAGEGRRGERLRDGFTVVIAGPPNAGKSTLLNALARRDVAIVSPYAGTTRDTLEAHLDLEGLPIVLVDTAGIRESSDPVEQEGVARARARAARADLVLWVVPVGSPEGTAEIVSVPTLRITNKIDLAGGPISAVDGLAISARTGQGIAELLERIIGLARESLVGAEPSLMTHARHRHVLEEAKTALDRACAASTDIFPELLAEEIRLAARALGRIAGTIDAESVLDEIFSRFCIGK